MALKFFKSAFGKIHYSAMLFISFNIITGALMHFGGFYASLATIHFISGLMIFTAPAVVFLFLPHKQNTIKAIIKMNVLSKGDFKRLLNMKNKGKLINKITAGILFYQLLIAGVSGPYLRFFSPLSLDIALTVRTLHIINFFVLIVVVPIHIIGRVMSEKKQQKISTEETNDTKG